MAGFLLWQLQPGLMYRHAMLSLGNLKDGRVHVIITSAFSQASALPVLCACTSMADDVRAWLLTLQCVLVYPDPRFILSLTQCIGDSPI